MSAWLSAFLLTQLVEVPIYTVALARCGGRRPVLLSDPVFTPRRVALAFGASLITHPVVFFVFPRVWGGGWWHQVAAAEAFAVAFEAAYLTVLGVRRSVWWALAANAASLGVGQLTRGLWGWP